ncbi:DEAD/DEAH box helicase [Sphingomonas sp. VNH70]|uniref:DEAD/DEAH box helicase n=1 Tax=Sphingomonas silueang TaxID=3156617 RepID=UPI0032B56F00
MVRVQTITGTTRLSRKRPLASLTMPGCALRLWIEPVDIALNADGKPVGSGSKVHMTGYYPGYAGPPHIGEEDRLIVRRLQQRLGDTDHEGCLTGAGGADLLDRIVATGRARWENPRGPVLRQGEQRAAALTWVHDDPGRMRLSVGDIVADSVVTLVAPPVVIDTIGGTVTPIDLGVPGAMAEQLLRLPPVGPEAVAGLAARWRDLVPAQVPAPVAPEIRDLGMIEPVPVVSLCIDKVAMQAWHGSRYRHGGKGQVPCAVARLTFAYAGTIVGPAVDDQTLLVREGDALVRFRRDQDAEEDAVGRLLLAGLLPLHDFDDIAPSARQAWDHVPDMPASPEAFTPFLIYEAELLRAEGWRVETTADFPLRVMPVEDTGLSATVVPSGVDWFDLELGVTIEGQRVDLVPALRRMLATFDAGELDALSRDLAEAEDVLPVALGDGRVVTVAAAAMLPVLRALLALAANEPAVAGTGSGPGFSRLDIGLLGELEATTPGLAWSGVEPLRMLARELTQLQLAPTPLPAGFTATLRPYQQTGFDWLEALGRAGFGGLLADDMGLGKTVQTLAHSVSRKAAGAGGSPAPVLILAPTSVLPNWQAEIARFAPGLSVLLRHGTGRHGGDTPIGGYDVVLTSYPLLVRDADILAAEPFSLVVFDEAHVLKNPRTGSHAAARRLKAERRLALTGTPVENRLTDAWALFDLVVPGLLGTQRDFQRLYRTPIEKHGDGAARARLARKLRPFLLRRTKDAVASDLPAKSVMQVAVVPAPAQMALHESQRLVMQQRVRDEIARVGLMRAQIMVLTALTRLRQVCCDPRLLPDHGAKPPGSAKLERLLELLGELIPEGRRIILFSQFTAMLDLIKPELDRSGHGWVELTGTSKDRRTPVARFQAGEVPLILVSLKAGGTGLNLTTADTVILYDPWWNPAVEAQAIDRAHRIGQRNPVFVYRMIASGTIEEKILDLQQRKAALAEALWSDEAATSAALTQEDIDFLLG